MAFDAEMTAISYLDFYLQNGGLHKSFGIKKRKRIIVLIIYNE